MTETIKHLVVEINGSDYTDYLHATSTKTATLKDLPHRGDNKDFDIWDGYQIDNSTLTVHSVEQADGLILLLAKVREALAEDGARSLEEAIVEVAGEENAASE